MSVVSAAAGVAAALFFAVLAVLVGLLGVPPGYAPTSATIDRLFDQRYGGDTDD